MEMTWQIQDAKNKFSEVIERAIKDGPQEITKHGKKTATVALARKLLTIAYHVWKEGVTFKKYELIKNGGHPLKISRAY